MESIRRRKAMSKRGWAAGLFIGFLLAVSLAAGATDNYKLVNGTEEFYYGHISLVDIKNDGKDPMVLREGATAAEPATLNLPLGPGDTIFTSAERRCEIQFDNGTVLRLDVNTELKIEALMAQSLSARTKISNLVLRRGRVFAMYKQYSSKEMFQIITANAAVKLAHNAVGTIGWAADKGTDVQIAFGRANVLYGPDGKDLSEKSVYKNEKMIVAPNHAASFPAIEAPSDFASWNQEINKNFDELHKGKTMIPKPVQRLNSAVFYFAQQYGNLYGEWIYDDYFGYVWRPFANDMRYPNGGWSPYYVGRWSNYNGQMFWVADEPWGWIPYHLGVWHWDAKRGWYWLPGSAFAPAWVDWAFFGGASYGWRPWSMWDWGWYGSSSYLYGGFYGYGPFDSFGNPEFFYWGWRYWNYYGNLGYYGWWGQGYLQGLPGQGGGSGMQQFSKVDRNQLQKPGTSLFPMPKEYKSGLKSLLAALKNGDETAVGSLRAVSGQARVISASDLYQSGLHNRAVRLDQFLEASRSLPANSPQNIILNVPPRSAQNSAYNASRAYDRGARLAMLQADAAVRALPAGENEGSTPLGRLTPSSSKALVQKSGVRARDWNPDVRIGFRAGLDVVYLSQRNEIYIPQLRINSSMADGGPVLTSDGHVRTGRPDSSGYSGGSSSSTGNASSGSSGGGGSASSGGSSSGGGTASSGSSSSSGGGHIRN
jgi:FecR protein